MSEDQKPGFQGEAQNSTSPDSAVEAALAKALLLKPDMTEQQKKIFRLEHQLAEARRAGAEAPAAEEPPQSQEQAPEKPAEKPEEQPAEDPRREAERQSRLNGEGVKKSVLKHLTSLPGLIGAGIVGAGLLYKKSKVFRYGVGAATLPFWAFPVLTWKATKGFFNNGPGGVGNAFGGAKNVAISGALMAKTALGLTARLAFVAFVGAVGMKTLTDASLGRSSLGNSALNALSSTFNETVQIGGRISRFLMPKAQSAFGVAEDVVVSGADTIDGVVSSGVDKVGGVVSSGTSALSDCVDRSEECSEALGDKGNNIVAKAFNGYTAAWAWTIKKYYFTAVPAIAGFAWDNTVCNIFNCSSDTSAATTPAATPAKPEAPARSAMASDEADKMKGLISGKKSAQPAPAPTPKAAPAESANPLAQLGYVQTGSRYVSVCTLQVLGKDGQHPALKDIPLNVFSDHNKNVGKIVQAMKSDPASPLYKAVTGDKVSNVVIMTSLFNSGAATADVTAQRRRLDHLPAPASVNGSDVPWLCREYPMDKFLEGKGIGAYDIPVDPVRVLNPR